MRALNALGYGLPRGRNGLNLVYNPAGASLPPEQMALEHAYKEQLAARHGIVFNRLFVLANMPIQRFGSQLVSRNEFHDYMRLLKGRTRDDNLGRRHVPNAESRSAGKATCMTATSTRCSTCRWATHAAPIHLSALLDRTISTTDRSA